MYSIEVSSLSSLLSLQAYIKQARYDFQVSYAQPLSTALTFSYYRYIYCFSDRAEMLFPNAHPQNPVRIAAGDHPPENPSVVDDVDIDAAENDDNYVDGRFDLLKVKLII